jgi:hypothetical protein
MYSRVLVSENGSRESALKMCFWIALKMEGEA